MVHLSPEFDPPILKGLKVHPGNPFRFDFILDQGDGVGGQPGDMKMKAPQGNHLSPNELKTESTKLIKYFLASLTIPEKDLWVNLSPYEKNRIIPQSFGLTEMGRRLTQARRLHAQTNHGIIYLILKVK